MFRYVYCKLFYTLHVFPLIFYIIYFKNLFDIENDFEVRYLTKKQGNISKRHPSNMYVFSSRKLNKCSDLTEDYAVLIVFFAEE